MEDRMAINYFIDALHQLSLCAYILLFRKLQYTLSYTCVVCMWYSLAVASKSCLYAILHCCNFWVFMLLKLVIFENIMWPDLIRSLL